MVLDEPLETDEDLIPSFDEGLQGHVSNDIPRSSRTISILNDYENIVVPKMIDMDWMSKAAKARSRPYYNDTDQNLNAHILPGVEILADITEQASKFGSKDLRDLIALWTVHDIHKIINDKEDEFSITSEQTKNIVHDLDMKEFNDELDIQDYQSCAVALHNNEPSKIDDSTNRFTQLRPILRLVDSAASISDPSEFVEQAERAVSKVFSSKNERYVPGSHKIELEDSITQQIVNKTLYQVMKNEGYIPIDIRQDGVLYARSTESKDFAKEMDEFLRVLTKESISNLRSAYQSFKNRSLLGSNIENPQSRLNYKKPPRVYDISNLSKTCLQKEEIVQRIVQASVEHQNKPYHLPDESESQIDLINQSLGTDIPKNTFVEGMAALVHTVYKDILPEIVDSDSEEGYERTLEGGLLYIFDCSEDLQHRLIESIENDNIKSSPVEWPHKYLIAHELHKEYTTSLSRTEREDKLTRLLLDRLSDFTKWKSFNSNSVDRIEDEFYIRLASNIDINGTKASDCQNVNIIDKINQSEKQGNCKICGTATSQSAISPTLLSHNDFDILDITFATDRGDSIGSINLEGTVPKYPVCVMCQIALTIRAQQFNKYKDDTNLHVSIHSVSSVSVSSYKRFDLVLNLLKRRIFTENSSFYYPELGNDYRESITKHLEQGQAIESFTRREKAFEVGSRRDESSSCFELPDNSRESIIKAVTCVTVASLISGVKACITKKPQICIDQSKKKDVVTIGPDLESFSEVMNSRKDIIDLPRRIKVIDRIIRIGELTGSVDATLRFYADISDQTYLPGSRVFSRINHMTDEENAYKIVSNTVNLDIIASENDMYSREVLYSCSKIADDLEEATVTSEISEISELVEDIFQSVFELDQITNNSANNVIIDELSNNSNSEVSALIVAEDGTVDSLSSGIVELVEKYDSDGKITNPSWKSIKNCIVTQLALTKLDHGDDNA